MTTSSSAAEPAAVGTAADDLAFAELVFSDLRTFRGGAGSGWLQVLRQCLTTPGMVASLVVRGQQCLHRAGHTRLANIMRSVGISLVGGDFGPGMRIGTGFSLVHPVGVTIGFGLTVGNNVTFAGGVVAAARHPEEQEGLEQEFATICDGAIIGAHAVLVGGVRIGEGAMVGANSVVLSDVPDHAVVMGVPARQVGRREPGAAQP
ncbi:MAG: serine O-acetyltransferase [Marmoricola sp.]